MKRVVMLQGFQRPTKGGGVEKFHHGCVFNLDEELAAELMAPRPPIAWPEGEPLPIEDPVEPEVEDTKSDLVAELDDEPTPSPFTPSVEEEG